LTGTKTDFQEFDEPEEILDTAVEKQRKLLSGLGGIKQRIDLKKYQEAQDPNQVAISLSGEPTFYPKLGEFIKACHARKMSTFLVTNGTNPQALTALAEKQALPTQLYVSLEAPSPELHKRINVPLPESHWQAINQTFELLPSLKTRTCVRVTAIKGLNMDREKEFAEMLAKAKPDFVEVKGYMWVGFSRHRLKEENMPLHSEVKDFAERINKHLGYKLEDEFKDSRVVLLWNGKTPLKIPSKNK
jgi:tRNA wybutosine-synthesizing protein 1